MRKSCNVFIHVDVARAMQDGLEFYVSTNRVVLSPGNAEVKEQEKKKEEERKEERKKKEEEEEEEEEEERRKKKRRQT